MKQLESIKEKLIDAGYTVFIADEKGSKYLKGGYKGEDIEKQLSTDIKVFINENQYVFVNWNKQISNDVYFNSEDELMEFIISKYPI